MTDASKLRHECLALKRKLWSASKEIDVLLSIARGTSKVFPYSERIERYDEIDAALEPYRAASRLLAQVPKPKKDATPSAKFLAQAVIEIREIFYGTDKN
jgi:hypothetical protein